MREARSSAGGERLGAPGRSSPGGKQPKVVRIIAVLRRLSFIAMLKRPRNLQMFALPSWRGKTGYMGHVRPLALGPCGRYAVPPPLRSIESIPPDILKSARWDMLCQFQQETAHGKRLDLSLEEIAIGGVGDHRGLSILFDTDLVLGEAARPGASRVLVDPAGMRTEASTLNPECLQLIRAVANSALI